MTEDTEPLLPDASGKGAKKEIGVFALVVISFFWVSGGMYGNEEMMMDATPVHALFGLLLTPLFYSMPLVLITTELASVMPWEGGSVAWVQEAFGKSIGAHNAYWTWVAGTIDASLYPRFAGAYIVAQINSSGRGSAVESGFFAALIVAGVTAIKLFGVKPLVSMNTVVLFIVMLPSLLFLCFALPSINPSVVFNNDPPHTNFDALLVWLLWLYGGVLNMGSVAEEVDTPSRTYIVASVVLLSLDVVLVNFLPLLLSLSIEPDRSQYTAGHFALVGEQVAGKWLSIMLTSGAQISQIGLYASISLAADRFLSQFMRTQLNSQNSRVRSIFGPLAPFLLDAEHTGAPRFVILINASIHFTLAWFPIVDILRYSQTIVSVYLLMLVSTYIYLKYKQPTLPRAFSVPGGVTGAVLVCLPCTLLTLINLGYAFVDPVRVMGLPARVVFFVVVASIGLILHGGYLVYVNRFGESDADDGGLNDERTRVVAD